MRQESTTLRKIRLYAFHRAFYLSTVSKVHFSTENNIPSRVPVIVLWQLRPFVLLEH